MSNLPRFLLRLLWFYLGLIIMSAGIAATISAHVGAGPWDVFHVALSQLLPMTVGQAIVAVGLLVVGIGWLLGVRPFLGTVLNMICTGLLVDRCMPLMPHTTGYVAPWVLLLCGALLNGLGTGMYMGAALGAGPRDGLMVGLTRRFTWPVGAIRVSMEVTVALVGWWLGGPLGLGTVVLALILGPCTQLGITVMNWLAVWPVLGAFVEPVALKRRPAAAPATR